MGRIRRKNFDDADGLPELPLLTVSLARIGSHVKGLDRPIEVYRLA